MVGRACGTGRTPNQGAGECAQRPDLGLLDGQHFRVYTFTACNRGTRAGDGPLLLQKAPMQLQPFLVLGGFDHIAAFQLV